MGGGGGGGSRVRLILSTVIVRDPKEDIILVKVIGWQIVTASSETRL